MSLVLSDRVKETSITTGTGAVSLGGTFGAFQSFGSSVGDGNQTYYGIENESRWEVGLGTYTASEDTLSRDTVLDGSDGPGSPVDLNGVSIVFCTYPASKAVYLDPSDDLDLNLNLTQLTTFKLSEAGNAFHSYVDDAYDRTVSLYNDGTTSPMWKLGLKTSPDDVSEPPQYGYVYGQDDNVGLVANASNSFSLANAYGLTIKHKGYDLIRAHAVTGVHIDSPANSYPALTVDGGSSHTDSIQEWAKDGGTVLSLIDKDGNLQLGQTTTPAKLNVYNKFITTSSYERLSVYGQLSSNFIIAAEADGVGAVRDIEFPTAVQFTGDVSINKTTENAGLMRMQHPPFLH
jgi:hypothetical protein